MNLYITGGHLTPALAVIDVLQRKHEEIHIFFVGRSHAQTYPRQESHEQREIEARGIPFFAINAAKFHRERFWLNLLEILKFPLAFFEVISLFREKRPDAVLSFGGYVAFPVCVMGKIFGARVVTHEQTKAAGLANQVIASIADTIAVASQDSLAYFPKEKTVVTGNPIRESLLREYKQPPSWFPKKLADQPFIYITGGSQGSQIINNTIAVLLPKLAKHFVVIHQCGVSTDHAYVKELDAARDGLPEDLRERYIVREWIDAKEVSFLLRNAKFVISRAGANTVQELTLSGTPAIFIPLSFAYHNEQEKNARSLVDYGAGILLLQKDLVPETLYGAVQTMNRRYDRLKERAMFLATQTVRNGAQRVVQLLLVKDKKTSSLS